MVAGALIAARRSDDEMLRYYFTDFTRILSV